MAWKTYDLDRIAQRLVLDAKERDKDSLGQAFKMRVAVAYGLERFWGEHLRLQGKKADEYKAKYWKETWDQLVAVMLKAGVKIPNDPVQSDNEKAVRSMAEKLWQIDIQDQRVAIAVLTQLCDCLVWWTQRYKKK
ncbi:hypothetical protein H6F44_12700 [Pseudanabaena sp. FACHB-1277]|jgi:hypothetical protein|uniref:Uncharacterized protein n=1 Tax=Pseudanabaena cinerea FACHB-1277 TaxID=2949581 RepID=A0A926UTE8_9CYAN|nr:hypothetical protein [Pseudanabaena cinerea]MBD2150971.1 hypothetical protein [Pseudanabaena cinerea FACHB-1277]